MNFRQLFKDIAIYGIGDILLKATAFITLPIYTRIFTPEDYGIWNLIFVIAGFLSSILALGGESAYARFFFEVKTLREKQLITSTWLSFLALWSLAVIVCSLPFTEFFSQWSFNTNEYGILFMLALLTIPISLVNSMCGQVLRNQFRSQLFTILNVVTTLLTIGLNLFAVVVLSLGVVGVVGGTFVAAVIMLPIRLWTARTMLRPIFSVQLLRNLLAYGVPLVPMTIAYWIFGTSDRLVLGKLSTLEQVGLYAVANNLTSVLAFVNNAFGQAWSPHAVRVYEEEPEYAPIFYGQVMTYILVGFGILSVGITSFAHEALMILSTPSFYPAAFIVGPLLLGFMASASTQITAAGISLTKKTKYFTIYSWIAALLNFGLNVWLVPKWGMMAASWTTAVSYTFLTVAYLITSQRLWPVVYEKRRGVTVVALTVIFAVAAPLLPNFDLIANLALKSIYCLAYMASLFAFRVLDQREWQALLNARKELQTRGTR